jgi:hypothetical protein
LQKGASSARSDDTKSLKSVIIDWITPRGQSLTPPIARNVKLDRGFNHEVTGGLLCPTGLDWSNSELRIRLPLNPDLHDNVVLSFNRVKEQLRNGTYMVPGDQWPVFIYKDCKYDPENPWDGLLRSVILVSVGPFTSLQVMSPLKLLLTGIQAYFYFTQLSGEGSESHLIWKCLYTQYDERNAIIHCVCRHTGSSSQIVF